MSDSESTVEAHWEALRTALEPLSPEAQSVALADFARLVRMGVQAWINRPRDDESAGDAVFASPWNSITCRQEFIAWGRELLRRLDEHMADVRAHPGEWKQEWEDTWANTDLGGYLEAMITIIEARRFE